MSAPTQGVIVTAGSDPMNLQVIQILHEDGFRVVHTRDVEDAAAPADPQIPSLVHPITDFTSAQVLLELIESTFGWVAGLVTPLPPSSSRAITDVDAAGWNEFRQSDIKRNVAMAKAGVQVMSSRGGGRIVVLSSTSAFYGSGIEQAAANAAMISLSNAVTLSIEATQVTSNCVVVGSGEDRGGLAATTATSGEMVGRVVSFLLGDGGSEISGQLVACSGTTVGLYVPPLIIESTNVLVKFDQTPSSAQIGAALEPLLATGRG